MDGTLDINGRVQFVNHVEFVINGTLNLHPDAGIHLANESTILVEDRPAMLGLTWSAKISCAPLDTGRTVSPSDCAIGEELARGDCIIARNGEVIAVLVNPPLLPCSPFARECQKWRDYYRLWTLSRLLRQCSCDQSRSSAVPTRVFPPDD